MTLFLMPFTADRITIDLDDVPSRLAFPLPDGSNQILTARINSLDGIDVEGVWFVHTNDRSTRTRWIPLSSAGMGSYRINLAGRDVLEALEAHGASGEFRIHAAGSGGATGSSIART